MNPIRQQWYNERVTDFVRVTYTGQAARWAVTENNFTLAETAEARVGQLEAAGQDFINPGKAEEALQHRGQSSVQRSLLARACVGVVLAQRIP